MVTIDNYSFILVGNNRMRLAKPNEMNDPRRKIIIVGTLRSAQEDKKNQVLEVQSYEKTYIIGSYNSYNSTYYLGKKSKEMKEFEQMKPVLVIGRNAGSFLGEYMAGGPIVLLGLGMKRGEKLFGTHCASGMHGGKIFVRGSFPKENISPNIKVTALTDADRQELEGYLKKYCKYFGVSMDEIMKKPFKKLAPATSRPYANLYTPN